MNQSPKLTTVQRGKAGEDVALAYLQSRGFRLVARNYRCRRGEIDLILAREKELVFVEVRSRSRKDYGLPEETVDSAKQRKIRFTAQFFLQQNPKWENCYCRFDVISILWDTNRAEEPLQIQWYPDAFQ